jgi:hypothetical protein
VMSVPVVGRQASARGSLATPYSSTSGMATPRLCVQATLTPALTLRSNHQRRCTALTPAAAASPRRLLLRAPLQVQAMAKSSVKGNKGAPSGQPANSMPYRVGERVAALPQTLGCRPTTARGLPYEGRGATAMQGHHIHAHSSVLRRPAHRVLARGTARRRRPAPAAPEHARVGVHRQKRQGCQV